MMLAPEEIIYLDSNATTQLDPAVVEEMLPFLAKYYGNPSSGYRFGGQIREAIEIARDRVAQLLGCLTSEIIFTSCGTESNNTALNSALQLDPARQHIITTAVEHSAIQKHCAALVRRGVAVTAVGVSSDGILDLDELRAAIRPATALISVMWANNETGVIFPVREIARIARENRVLFHTDAVQAAGKIPVRLAESGINLASFSAHKLHGPKGVGALYVDRRTAFRASLVGGGQESDRRAGTENVASIVAFGKAAELAHAAMNEEQSRVLSMRDRFEQTLLEKVPDAFLNGDPSARLPNTSSMSFGGTESETALLLLDQERLCCSAGSACRTGAPEGSHVLRAMNLPENRIRGSLRFSFSRFNRESEVDRALEIVPRVIAKLRALTARPAMAAPV